MYSLMAISNQFYHEAEMAEENSFELGYYMKGYEETRDQARFFGPLAKTLGIEGKAITREDAAYIMNGFDPTHRRPGELKPLRKNANVKELEMALVRRETQQLTAIAEARQLTKAEQQKLKENTIALEDWSTKLKESAEKRRELEAYDKGKECGFIRLGRSKKSIPYTEEHEIQRQKLAQEYAKMPGAQRCGTDFTYSPDKAVNAIYVAATEEEKEIIRVALKEAVEETWAERLKNDTETRRQLTPETKDINGKTIPATYEKVPADALAVGFVHDSTRPTKDRTQPHIHQHSLQGLECPGLHYHGLLFNASQADDGEYRSLHTDRLEKARKEMDAETTARLVEKLNKLGFAIDGGELRKKAIATLSVPGITEKELSSISLRSEEIEQERQRMEQNGELVEGWKLGAKTRSKKRETDPKELHAAWSKHFDNLGITRQKLGVGEEGAEVRNELQRRRELRKEQSEIIADFNTVSDLSKGKSYYTEADLREALWRDAIRTGDMNVEARLKRITTNKALTIEANGQKFENWNQQRGNDRYNGRVFITREGVKQERELDEVVKRMRQGGWDAANEADVRESINGTESKKTKELKLGSDNPFKFREDQIGTAVRALCGTERLLIVEAPPGSGKTTALMAVVDFLKAQKRQTIVLAPSHKAKGQAMKDAGVEEGHAVQGFVRSKRKLDSIKPGGFIFVDEGSMVDLPDMLKLISEAEKRGAKVVIFGDTNQLAAVGRGDPMKRITELEPEAVQKLTHITRQNDEAHKQAVWSQFRGEHEEAIRRLDELKLIRTFNDENDKATAFAEFYFSKDKSGKEIPAEAKVLTAGTNRDCRVINELIREERIRRGEVGNDGFTLRCETAGGEAAKTFAKGDRILFVEGIGKDDGKGGVVSLADTSDTGTVLSIVRSHDKRTATFRVAIDGKGIVEFEAEHGAKLDHSYVMTTHRSQGLTTRLSGHYASTSMTGAESLLVGMSRHKEEFALFATHREREVLTELAARKTEKIRSRDFTQEPSTDEERKIQRQYEDANARIAELAEQVRRAETYGTTDKLQNTIERVNRAAKFVESSIRAIEQKLQQQESEKSPRQQAEEEQQDQHRESKDDERRENKTGSTVANIARRVASGRTTVERRIIPRHGQHIAGARQLVHELSASGLDASAKQPLLLVQGTQHDDVLGGGQENGDNSLRREGTDTRRDEQTNERTEAGAKLNPSLRQRLNEKERERAGSKPATLQKSKIKTEAKPQNPIQRQETLDETAAIAKKAAEGVWSIVKRVGGKSLEAISNGRLYKTDETKQREAAAKAEAERRQEEEARQEAAKMAKEALNKEAARKVESERLGKSVIDAASKGNWNEVFRLTEPKMDGEPPPDLTITDKQGNGILHIAARVGCDDIARAGKRHIRGGEFIPELENRMSKFGLDVGAERQKKNADERTPSEVQSDTFQQRSFEIERLRLAKERNDEAEAKQREIEKREYDAAKWGSRPDKPHFTFEDNTSISGKIVKVEEGIAILQERNGEFFAIPREGVFGKKQQNAPSLESQFQSRGSEIAVSCRNGRVVHAVLHHPTRGEIDFTEGPKGSIEATRTTSDGGIKKIDVMHELKIDIGGRSRAMAPRRGP